MPNEGSLTNQVKVKVTLRLTVSQSVNLGVEPQSCFFFCGAPSLTRGRACLLYMLLALASAVFLGSEFPGSRDHILLSQIWDFPFRRLLRLAGSRWRYSTPPPHGLLFITSGRTEYVTMSYSSSVFLCLSVAAGTCLSNRCLAMVIFVTIFNKQTTFTTDKRRSYSFWVRRWGL
jgi:hypothetical protein